MFDEGDQGFVYVTWTPRSQDEYVVLRCATNASVACSTVTSYQATAAWCQTSGLLHSFTRSGSGGGGGGGGGFLYLLRDNELLYTHVLEVDQSAGTERFVTEGQYHVVSIDHIYNGRIHITTTARGDGYRDSAWVSTDDVQRSFQGVVCVTCNDTHRTYTTSSFSGPSMVAASDGPGYPPMQTLRLAAEPASTVYTLEDNSDLQGVLKGRAIPIKTFHTFDIPALDGDEGQSTRVFSALCPPGNDNAPALVDVYGGQYSTNFNIIYHEL